MPKIQMRRDTAENWKTNNPTLLSGEWALETDTRRMKIGDGTTPYNTLPYSTADDREEWEKPAEWVDIRSAALENSIYLLVAHSADYSTYAKLSIQATVSSGDYDVYIDGVKQYTTASATTTVIDWQTLALSTGWDVTYPSSLRTHIVRITPATTSATITKFFHAVISGQTNQGTLWLHFAINNAINIEGCCNTNGVVCPILEAVTTPTGELEITGVLSRSFGYAKSLLTLPKLIRTGTGNCSVSLAFRSLEKIKKIELENVNMTQSYSIFDGNFALKEIKVKNCKTGNSYGSFFDNCYALRRIPNIISPNATADFMAKNLRSLEPTVIDLSVNENIRGVYLQGSSTYPVRGIKGLIVCSTAPFTSTQATQINVSYTGMDRAALVALFNSMPTVTASQVCNIRGATGANDLTAEDIAVAVNKGWTITR